MSNAAAISAKDVAELRKRTGAGMMDCKKALEENGGDLNKAAEIKETPVGSLQIKAKWDKGKLHREIETRDAVKVTEDYELSPDGKQLFVNIKTESRVVRNVQTAPIRRVYDRAQ